MDANRSMGQSGSPGARATSLLVGRARERVFLREELAATFGGRGRLVLLGGVAGIGKTSLARDLTREAEDLGVRVLPGHCYDLTNTPPYGPWLNLFGGDQGRGHLPIPRPRSPGGGWSRSPISPSSSPKSGDSLPN